jgi:hypothetical protein
VSFSIPWSVDDLIVSQTKVLELYEDKIDCEVNASRYQEEILDNHVGDKPNKLHYQVMMIEQRLVLCHSFS